MIKKILLGLAIVLVLIQFVRHPKNDSGAVQNDIATLYPMPNEVKLIVDKACADCHSNKTVYPWYANIQPFAYLINDHVVDGKRHFNFNEFASYRIAKQNHKLEELIEQVKESEMPMESYTLIHQNAKLSETEKNTLVQWCQSIMDTLKANYPADSLIIKRGPTASK